MSASYISLLAGDKAEVLKNLHNAQLHHQESKPHAHTIPWPSSKWKKGVRIYGFFVFFAKSAKGSALIKTNRHTRTV